MPNDESWKRLIADGVEEAQRLVEYNLSVLIEEAWPALVDMSPPDDRTVFYDSLADGSHAEGLTWDKVREVSAQLYAKMTDDALNLEERRRRQQQEALREWERQQYTAAAAFRPQLTPYGYIPGSPSAGQLGLSGSLPMGRFGR